MNAGYDVHMLNGDPLNWNAAAGDVEMGFGKPPSLNIDEYRFWRERLVTLHEAYQKAKPTSLKQWWQDRRDSSQWTTFWLAVVAILLTLLFGLIQSVRSSRFSPSIVASFASDHSVPSESSNYWAFKHNLVHL